jgi:hypothetical protein
MIDENRHLKRACGCVDCQWIGINGQLIAKDKLRCPRCGSDYIIYYTSAAPKSLQ